MKFLLTTQIDLVCLSVGFMVHHGISHAISSVLLFAKVDHLGTFYCAVGTAKVVMLFGYKSDMLHFLLLADVPYQFIDSRL